MRKTEADVGRLCEGVRTSIRVLEPYRRARLEAVRKYAGDQWSTETSFVPRPVNFLSLYLQVMIRSLVANDPRVSLSVMKREYRATVSAFEEWINPEIVRMKLVDSLQRGVTDALYGFHVMKVALATPKDAEMSGWQVKAGVPFAKTIDLDDWVMDPHARTLNDLAWCGHRYRIRINQVKNPDMAEYAQNQKYARRQPPPEGKRKLQPNPDKQYNMTGDQRISTLGRQFLSNDQTEVYDYADLWEIYLPMERKIVTLLSEDGGAPCTYDDSGKPVPYDERDWVGPDSGPYHFLNLMPPVSGNAMPKGPVQDLIGMDEHLNGLMQKLLQQASRQKEILAYQAGSEDDANRIANAADGEIIRVDNIDKLKPMAFGGPAPNNHQFLLGLWEILNKIGGNVELLGGLGAQSKTATQDKLLNANSSTSMKFMQSEVVKHTSNVMTALLWFCHHHPEKVMTSYHPIEGLPNPIERTVTPQDRQKIPFEAMAIKVDPYSLQHQSPGERMAFLNQTVSQIIIPLMPILQQQGLSFNMAKYLDIIARYGDAPDVTEVVESLAVSTAGDGPSEQEEQPGKPANTTRQYTRINASEKTDEGQSKVMQAALLGYNTGGNPKATGAY